MIVAAAIQLDDKVYALPAPARHHDIIEYLHRIGVGYGYHPDNQGFIDSNEGFVRREVAFFIVLVEQQPLRGGRRRPATCELFSEDLW